MLTELASYLAEQLTTLSGAKPSSKRPQKHYELENTLVAVCGKSLSIDGIKTVLNEDDRV